MGLFFPGHTRLPRLRRGRAGTIMVTLGVAIAIVITVVARWRIGPELEAYEPLPTITTAFYRSPVWAWPLVLVGLGVWAVAKDRKWRDSDTQYKLNLLTLAATVLIIAGMMIAVPMAIFGHVERIAS